jgi:tetratricopeptide (TPR) repeat protein
VSDSETEITLGFGRALSPALSVGGTVKMQRQSLAGYSGSGLGADLGVLVKPGLLLGSAAPWSDRLALGIAVRNAIEPSLRLDQESVADPATARAGFSYRHPFLGGRMLTLGMDFERAAGTGARFHSGLEVKMHPQLTLRAGTSHGALAAGTSIQWRELAFEYAYESGDLEAVHRVGISRPIGPTSGARRDAALLAEERAMLARVDAAARARLDDQVLGLMDEARAAMAGGDYDHALDLLGTVTTIAPGHPGATAAEAASLAGKAARLEQEGDFMGAALLYGRALAVAPGDTAATAGERRCRAESDRRAARSEEIRRLVSAGLDALASDRPPAARDAFARILALDPGDREAAAMLKRTERAMEARAVSPPRPARRSEPAPVHAAPDSAPARAAAKPKPATKEVDDLYRKGLAAMSQGRSDAALRYWELVQSLHPSYQRVAEYLVREYLTRGMEQFAAGRVEEAMGHWQKALDVDPLDERARGYMARAQTQLARTRELTGGPR